MGIKTIFYATDSFILVILLSGAQFGLKSCAYSQNERAGEREFDLKSQDSMVSDLNCTTRVWITTDFEIRNI